MAAEDRFSFGVISGVTVRRAFTLVHLVQVLNAIALREALCRFRMRQGRVELFERPVYFAAGDHQGWTNTDGVVVGILAQDAARLRMKLNGDH